ncbi:uncharacterized protein LOC101162837 isoform X3 [Oryzias latipes]|uniref:uncharacterized protein LOC101162837 isoform X3 n=1 Tax=Oryzias latipes TaxID=8090 RepID=UPI000CE21DCA|nr:uncharacterized protein LOC101162837 isoform X3 [Oryzias latipes]XP_023812329.1 uncharacterized protein LOC101162837 isoform X3 [Oryzias latipes]
MDFSPVLGQQSQNKIRSDFERVKNEHNKRQVDQKLNKPLAPSHLLNKDTENKDPSESGQKAPVQAGISKLPVLAKSLRLQMPSHFKQSHHRWEEKPLAGKAKKKKPCTRPIPFNLSQPKNTKIESKSQLSVAASTKTHANKPESRILNVKHTKHRAALSSTWDSTEDVRKYHGKAAKKESHLPGQSEKKDNFQSDPSALLSILRNEGIDVSSRAPSSLQSRPYSYQPQRVSVLKSKQKPAPSSAGLVRPGHFSPDTAGLQCILLTDGVTAGAPVGATPRNSVCPPGRGTSIYTAQRVPVGKTPVEITGGPVAALKKTPQTKWTPQRVPNPSYQPMSAMKWHPSAQRSLHKTPGFESCKSKLQKEEIVQRLFCDAEDVQTVNVETEVLDAKTGEKQLPIQASSKKVLFEEKLTRGASNEEEETRETLLPEPPRESVIFMSTGKKLFRVSRFDDTESWDQKDQQGPVLEPQNEPEEHSEPSVGPEPIHHIIPSAQRMQKDLIAQKPCSRSSAVALLRKRFPPLEELRLDEEVAFFISLSLPSNNGCPPPRPRCENPLAVLLHFKESTEFLPIRLDPLYISSQCCSPLNE